MVCSTVVLLFIFITSGLLLVASITISHICRSPKRTSKINVEVSPWIMASLELPMYRKSPIIEQISASAYISSVQSCTDFRFGPFNRAVFGLFGYKFVSKSHQHTAKYKQNSRPYHLPFIEQQYVLSNSSTLLNDQLSNSSHIPLNNLLGNYPITLRFLWDI